MLNSACLTNPVTVCCPALLGQACWPLQNAFYFSVSHGLNSDSWVSWFFHLSVRLNWTSVSYLNQNKHHEPILWGTEKKLQYLWWLSVGIVKFNSNQACAFLISVLKCWGIHQSNNTYMRKNSLLRSQLFLLPVMSYEVFVTAVFSLLFLLIKWCNVSHRDLTASDYNWPTHQSRINWKCSLLIPLIHTLYNCKFYLRRSSLDFIQFFSHDMKSLN